MKSEIREIEVFITSDGEEFVNKFLAENHQEYIDAKDYFSNMTDCRTEDNEEVIERMLPYLKEVIKRIDK